MSLSSSAVRITIPAPPEQVRARALSVLAALPNATSTRERPEGAVAMTGISLLSWGEKVTVDITAIPEGSDVHLRSRSVLPFQIFAWTQNRRNIEWVLRGLDIPGTTMHDDR